MTKGYKVTTTTSYEVVTDFGQTIRVNHNVADKSVTIELLDANYLLLGEMEIPASNGKVVVALSELFNEIDNARLSYEDEN